MGYTTKFSGAVTIEPPLSAEERDYLTKFSETRRMHRHKGPYFVDGTGCAGQDHETDIINYNQPYPGQPGLWCQWVPTEEGDAIEWDGSEKFYDSADWMAYLIDHFLKPGALADLPFLQKNHTVNGVIKAQGEDMHDRWKLVVTDNVVTTQGLE